MSFSLLYALPEGGHSFQYFALCSVFVCISAKKTELHILHFIQGWYY